MTGLASGAFGDLARSAMHGEKHCTCAVAPGQACPMHRASEEDRSCRVRSADVLSEAALYALVGGWGVLPPSGKTITVFRAESLVDSASPSAIGRAHRPDAPPPRA